MKNLFFPNKILQVLILLSLVSCEGIFVPDPIDPRLPKYTDTGNNVGGAFINHEVWKSIVGIGFNLSRPEVFQGPAIHAWTNDSLVIGFNGQLPSEAAGIEFHLKGLKIRKFEDLLLLKDKKILLDGLLNSGICFRYTYTRDNTSYFGKGGIGQLYIRNVTLGDSLNTAMISGTFGFTCKDSLNRIMEVSYGRFDYRLGKTSNFFTYHKLTTSGRDAADSCKSGMNPDEFNQPAMQKPHP